MNKWQVEISEFRKRQDVYNSKKEPFALWKRAIELNIYPSWRNCFHPVNTAMARLTWINNYLDFIFPNN